MELQTISQISKAFHLSTRTLRYYEQILVLRKLRIPLKQIAFILQCENTAEIIDTFCQNLANVDDEITALSTIRDIIAGFISRLNDSIAQNGAEIKFNLMDDTALLEAVDGLTVQKIPLKEEKTVTDLQEASGKLDKLTDRDVRIVYLPPMTVASIHVADGEGSEQRSAEILDKFIADVNLKQIYPAARNFGFNNPDGIPDNDPAHGYERWISIPDDMEVPKPLVKKHLDGGVYAAHMIPMGAWDEGWLPLHEWVSNSKNYDFRWGTVEGVCGWLEEHLNYWDWNEKDGKSEIQLDLLMPVKPRFAAGTKQDK